MLKKLLTLVALIATIQLSNAQLNVTYISDLGYNENLSDIWGYAAPDGTEYALVGTANGTSIVSLADPAVPVQVAYIPGDNSTWRDIKVWGETAYVTTDSGDDGLVVIDMSDLPNTASFYKLTDFGAIGTLRTCHNIWIDEFGFAYLSGCNLNSGGMIYLDCATTPGTPIIAGVGPNTYAHDVYTESNKMYASEINNGVFGIYDVSDKQNTIYLGEKETDFSFTHNAWLNDAEDVLFTTDELANAPVGSYDVSDPSDIKTLDLFKPLATVGAGVIPHNVHVWDDWIIISYYSDGCILVDGSNPENLIEVGNFDTYIPAMTGFNGAWGAYPFLPSGLILISDIGNGLYVLQPNYVRACWLEGEITDANTGSGINNASVEIETTELNDEQSDATGEYKTGLAIAGTYDVTYSAPGYVSQTLSLALDNGVLTMQDVALVPLPNFPVTGLVNDASTGLGIANAQVVLFNNEFNFEAQTNANGEFLIPAVFEGDYEAVAGHWGHLATSTFSTVSGNSDLTITLDRGYRDEFAVDLGWTVTGNAETGAWERAEPFGTFTGNGTPYNPDFDLETDLGDQCYVTGNGPGGVGANDVDNGNTILTSPVMDLTIYTDPVVSFFAWFANGGGAGNPNDELVVRIDNGIENMELISISNSSNSWEGPFTFELDSAFLTENMVVTFETEDLANSGHLLEAAIDLFEITGDFNPVVSSTSNINTDYRMTANPNPFSGSLNVDYDLPEGIKEGRLVIYNALGQQVKSSTLSGHQGSIIIDDLIFKGIYLAQIEAAGFVSEPVKVIKF